MAEQWSVSKLANFDQTKEWRNVCMLPRLFRLENGRVRIYWVTAINNWGLIEIISGKRNNEDKCVSETGLREWEEEIGRKFPKGFSTLSTYLLKTTDRSIILLSPVFHYDAFIFGKVPKNNEISSLIAIPAEQARQELRRAKPRFRDVQVDSLRKWIGTYDEFAQKH
jgi:hypothetical protein